MTIKKPIFAILHFIKVFSRLKIPGVKREIREDKKRILVYNYKNLTYYSLKICIKTFFLPHLDHID